MKLKHLILGLLTIIIISCNQNGKYKPNELRKVTKKELLKNAEKRQSYNFDNVVYKNENGVEISLDSIKNIQNSGEWTFDKYINKENELVELILRKATDDDKEFQKKLIAVYETEIIEPVIPIEIDCNNIQNILTEVHSLDQDMRQNGNAGNINIDRENLVKVISLIEKCGMPTLNTVNREQMSAIWLVFQHADNYHRKKYLSQLKKSAENGDLSKSKMALMEDRILMYDNKQQIYGSQITEDRESGAWMIYDLENPETVDKRRKKVGLGSLKEYVKQWDIEFNVEQAE
ncbi:hypothetical protein LX77_03900 [Gelidibacter algens]|uniref:Lipoprotein n=1 Tax=Gelidibacter algens TaxID=49280 RepID=A0A1A7QHB6_9FLAO|nr:DUF6624 domain-containing protein [Gelidibacter algens]OBX18723.1 hypothetical protein A9996_18940 [Gelidibacter algens]RAJ17218.1 hypothetical protein LX77_03900 [Gelidibacter algens]